MKKALVIFTIICAVILAACGTSESKSVRPIKGHFLGVGYTGLTVFTVDISENHVDVIWAYSKDPYWSGTFPQGEREIVSRSDLAEDITGNETMIFKWVDDELTFEAHLQDSTADIHLEQ